MSVPTALGQTQVIDSVLHCAKLISGSTYAWHPMGNVVKATGTGSVDKSLLEAAAAQYSKVLIDSTDSPLVLDTGGTLAEFTDVSLDSATDAPAKINLSNGTVLQFGNYTPYSDTEHTNTLEDQSTACTVAADGMSITTSMSVSRGDLLCIYSQDTISGVEPHDSSSTQKPLEWAVAETVSGTTVILNRKLVDTYSTTPKVANWTQNSALYGGRGASIRNLDFSGSNNTQDAMRIEGTRDFTIENIRMQNAGQIRVKLCYNTRINELLIEGQLDTDQTYGVSALAVGSLRISNYRGWGCRHMFTTGCLGNGNDRYGTCHDILIEDFEFHGVEGQSGESVIVTDTHCEGYRVRYLSGTVYLAGDADDTESAESQAFLYAFGTRSRKTIFERCKVFGANGQKHAGWSLASSYDAQILDCEMDGGRVGVYSKNVFDTSPGSSGTLIRGCKFNDLKNEGILVDGGDCEIVDCEITNTGEVDTGLGGSKKSAITFADEDSVGLNSSSVRGCRLPKNSNNDYAIHQGALTVANLEILYNRIEGYDNCSLGLDRTLASCAPLERKYSKHNYHPNTSIYHKSSHSVSASTDLHKPVTRDIGVYTGNSDYVIGVVADAWTNEVCVVRPGETVTIPTSLVDGTYDPTSDGRVLYWDNTGGHYQTSASGTPILEAVHNDGSSVYCRVIAGEDVVSGGGGSGSTDLAWAAGTRTVSSSSGTNAIISEVDSTNSGLMTSAQLTTLNAALSSVDLSYTSSTRILANTGGTDVTLPEVDSTNPGLMTSANLSTLGSALQSVDLTYTASTRILANTGGDNVTLPEAGSDPGLMSSADKTKLDYISATSSVNVNSIDLSSGVTGSLPVSNLAGGTGAGSTSYWRGDGTWAVPPDTDTGITSVVQDTSPQLGGALDVNGNEISGAIDIHSTGDVILELGDAAGSNKVSIRDSGATEMAKIDSDGKILAQQVCVESETEYDLGTISSGTITLDPANGLHQTSTAVTGSFALNAGSVTLNKPIRLVLATLGSQTISIDSSSFIFLDGDTTKTPASGKAAILTLFRTGSTVFAHYIEQA